ncbi:MAG TPA: hypothetical protein VHB46_00950 [Burkholderiales bacterium]|nr:hypothetical protein [Burkholderiales bacterium]
MEADVQETLLAQLVKCRTGVELRRILRELGDTDTSTLDIPFGKHKLVWRAFGNTSSNISTIGLGTKPGRSLTERVTNAIDALLEDKVVDGVSPPESPRAAAAQWFGRPMSSSESGLFSWKDMPSGFDQKINVVLSSSEKELAPTIDVIDEGIGISAINFPQTIMSLQGGNKIRKKYLIGAFGQGGAATLAFCEYAVIFSRPHDDPRKIAFTIVRVLKLDDSYKEDCYAYLCQAAEDPKVFECSRQESIELFADVADSKFPPYERGTCVRHICYRLTNLDKSLQSSPGNLYHYLHYSIFDPLVPFRIVDLRSASHKNERVSGARNRLMANTIRSSQSREDDDSNIQIKVYRPMEYIVPVGSSEPSIGIEYWVVLAERKKGDKYELRSHSNELFVQQGFPIVGTLNGQNQGEYSGSLLRQLGLNLLSRHMVIHIDATNAESTVRRELFASSREGFKDGPVLENVLAMLRKTLKEDTRLFELENELTARITQREAETTKSEVKKELTRLLKDAGLTVRDIGAIDTEGRGEKTEVQNNRGPRPRNSDPLSTLPYPDVTKFCIVYPETMFIVHLNDSQSIVVETDADAAYDKSVQIRSEPPILEIATKAPLRGGRVRWRLRPTASAKAGDEGEVIATLTKPDGSQIRSSVLFEVVPAKEKESKTATGNVPPFEIIPITPQENSEMWNLLWSDDGDDPERQKTHAYKVFRTANKVAVYYSTIFSPYKEIIDRLKLGSPSKLALFTPNYEIWVGYHAILQDQQPDGGDNGLERAGLEEMQEIERQTVARVQVKQSLKNAEYAENKVMQAEASV